LTLAAAAATTTTGRNSTRKRRKREMGGDRQAEWEWGIGSCYRPLCHPSHTLFL